MLVLIIGVVIVGAGAFFAGMQYQKSQRSNFAGQFSGGQGETRSQGQNQGRFGQGFRPVNGEIISADDKSITVKLRDGSSKIIILSNKTSINKSAQASKSDLKTGEKVAVFGTENSDGSITAQNVQLNPMIGGGFNRSRNQGQKSSDAMEIVIEGSNYKFTPEKITVKKGEKTRIVFKSKEGFHDFRVDELKIATAVIQSGEEDFVEFTPDKTGTFEFYCSFGNHRAMGMKGTLVVE